MYSDDIKNLKKEKREANLTILLDFLKIYLRMRIGFPNLTVERERLVKLVQLYFNADGNESEILDFLNLKYGNRDQHELVDEILDEFDTMFDNLYDHCQRTFADYEDVMEDYGDLLTLLTNRLMCSFSGTPYAPAQEIRYRMIHYPIQFQVFDDAYKEKMKEKVKTLPEPVEEEF